MIAISYDRGFYIHKQWNKSNTPKIHIYILFIINLVYNPRPAPSQLSGPPELNVEITDVDDSGLRRPLSGPVRCWAGEARCYETFVPGPGHFTDKIVGLFTNPEQRDESQSKETRLKVIYFQAKILKYNLLNKEYRTPVIWPRPLSTWRLDHAPILLMMWNGSFLKIVSSAEQQNNYSFLFWQSNKS